VESLSTEQYDGVQLFEGVDGLKLPTPDFTLFRSGIFKNVGKLMAHSAINTNVAFVGLHPIVSNVLFGGSINHQWPFTEKDVPDTTMQQIIIMVCNHR
jgi:hypothetical protein